MVIHDGVDLFPFGESSSHNIAVLQNTYIRRIFFSRHNWREKQKSPKYETAKYSFEFSYTISNSLSMLDT